MVLWVRDAGRALSSPEPHHAHPREGTGLYRHHGSGFCRQESQAGSQAIPAPCACVPSSTGPPAPTCAVCTSVPASSLLSNVHPTVGCVAVLVTYLRLNLCDPMDCGPPGSSVHGDSPGKNNGVDCHALLQGIFPTQGAKPPLLGLLH